MGVDFAQAVQKVHEDVSHQPLRHLILPHLDLLLQRAPALVAHHHVDGLVRAKEIQHAHDIGMIDLGECTPLLEETLHPVTERGKVLRRARAYDVAFGPQHQRRGQIFLDRHRAAAVVEGAIDDRKPAAADLAIDPVIEQLITGRKSLVGDAHE